MQNKSLKMRYQDILKWAEGYLLSKGVDTPRLDAEVLIGHVLNKSRAQLFRDLLEPISPKEEALIKEIIVKRGSLVPAAYLTGLREFMSLDFKVTPDVLIPRPETELLVEKVIAELKNSLKPIILDVGTGSGAIAISLAKYLPQAQIYAIDISPKALEVARENAHLNEIEKQITFLQGNLLEPLPGSLMGEVSCIAANLPYIPEGEMPKLQAEVRLNEPTLALVAGSDGFDLYRRLIPQAVEFLSSNGILALEIGYDQGNLAPQYLEQSKWEKLEIITDYQQLDRIVWVRKI